RRGQGRHSQVATIYVDRLPGGAPRDPQPYRLGRGARRPRRRRRIVGGPVAEVRHRAAVRRPRPAEEGRRPRAVDRRRRGRIREAAGNAGPLRLGLAERRCVMPALRRLNNAGVARFEQYLAVLRGGGTAEPPTDALTSPEHSESLDLAIDVEDSDFDTRLDWAK